MTSRNQALLLYIAAALAIVAGAGAAFARYPDGFDWSYTVISKLASRKHNPAGGIWLSGALLAAAALLWPAIGHLAGQARGARVRPRLSIGALRVGLIGAVLLALEGLLTLDLTSLARKGHEALALITLVGLYGGVLGLYVQRIRHRPTFLWPALCVLLPLAAIGVSQLTLYFDQRELGWVSTSWRELGVPVWLSFAFWQWLAVAALGAAIGHLIVAGELPAHLDGEPAPRS